MFSASTAVAGLIKKVRNGTFARTELVMVNLTGGDARVRPSRQVSAGCDATEVGGSKKPERFENHVSRCGGPAPHAKAGHERNDRAHRWASGGLDPGSNARVYSFRRRQ